MRKQRIFFRIPTEKWESDTQIKKKKKGLAASSYTCVVMAIQRARHQTQTEFIVNRKTMLICSSLPLLLYTSIDCVCVITIALPKRDLCTREKKKKRKEEESIKE